MASRIVHTARLCWNASRSEHPARIASWQALDAVTRGDKEGYLSLYAPDGVIHDPVGRTAMDPTGLGHRGHDALATFWDEAIAKAGELSFHVHTSLATDDRVANSFTLITQRPGGQASAMECIFVYRVDESGLLLHVGGYWEIPQERPWAPACFEDTRGTSTVTMSR